MNKTVKFSLILLLLVLFFLPTTGCALKHLGYVQELPGPEDAALIEDALPTGAIGSGPAKAIEPEGTRSGEYYSLERKVKELEERIRLHDAMFQTFDSRFKTLEERMNWIRKAVGELATKLHEAELNDGLRAVRVGPFKRGEWKLTEELELQLDIIIALRREEGYTIKKAYKYSSEGGTKTRNEEISSARMLSIESYLRLRCEDIKSIEYTTEIHVNFHGYPEDNQSIILLLEKK